MIDPQASAYDDFDEDAESVFRVFDEGEKMITRRPEASGLPSLSKVETIKMPHFVTETRPVDSRGFLNRPPEAHPTVPPLVQWAPDHSLAHA